MLYKKQFLIAYYTDKEELLFVADNTTEFLREYKRITGREASRESLHSLLCRMSLGKRSHKNIKLIEATEVHDDIFEEEDLIFNDFIEQSNLIKTHLEKYTSLAKESGMSVRTLYRKLERERNCHERKNLQAKVLC